MVVKLYKVDGRNFPKLLFVETSNYVLATKTFLSLPILFHLQTQPPKVGLFRFLELLGMNKPFNWGICYGLLTSHEFYLIVQFRAALGVLQYNVHFRFRATAQRAADFLADVSINLFQTKHFCFISLLILWLNISASFSKQYQCVW